MSIFDENGNLNEKEIFESDNSESKDSNSEVNENSAPVESFVQSEKKAESEMNIGSQSTEFSASSTENSANNIQNPQSRPNYPYTGVNQGAQGAPYNPNMQYYGQNNPNPYANGGINRQYPYSSNNYYPYANGVNPQNNGYAYQKKEEDTKKKKKNTRVFAIVAALLFVGVMIGIIVGLIDNSSPETSLPTNETNSTLNVEEFATEGTPNSPANVSSDGILTSKDIFLKVKESSVGILVYGPNKSLSSEGTGIIITEDKDGKYTYIVTCAHVISDKKSTIMVQLYNGKDYAAQVIGFDVKTDIGVLRIEESGLKIPEYGDSSKLSVGDVVYAIGNPGGTEFANSFTNGMISAIDRPVSSSSTGYTMECIQHTAAINPGNSGGALVNEYGQVIGVNSMKIIADEYEGMGFSVPSSVFMNIVNEIISNGYVSNRPKLGITYVSASSEQSYAMYVAIKGLPSGSIIVYSISDDSDLKNSDVKKGDMIISVNGKNLNEPSDLSEVIENSKVGDTLTLGIVRINEDYTSKEFSVKVKLTEDRGDVLPEEETSTSPFGGFFGDGNDGSNGGYGSDPYQDFFDEFFGRFYGEGR